MIILLPLLRRIGVRGRLAFGAALTAAGLLLTVISVVAAPGLVIHGIVTAVVGAIFLGSGLRDRGRGRLGRDARHAGRRLATSSD